MGPSDARNGLALVQRSGWWALQDSNLQPTDYESAALTIELRARWVLFSVSALPGFCRHRRSGAVIRVDANVTLREVASPYDCAASPAA